MQDIIFSELLNLSLFVILAISLNLINGFTGMLSLGHAAFFGIGAYTASIYMNQFDVQTYSGMYWGHFILGSGLAMLVAALLGLFVALPCLRLSGDYLAIATLAFAEIMRIVISSFKPDIFGGPNGLGLSVEKLESHWAFGISLLMILVVIVLVRNLKVSATGRAFLAIRENEITAQVMGMNTALLKVQAFVIGSAIAGLAGALYAYSRYQISPKDFDLMKTIMILLMIVLGGLGSISGAVTGAIILGLINPLVRYAPELVMKLTGADSALPLLQKAKENPQLIYAALLLILIRLRPEGIFGLHEISDLWRKNPTSAASEDNL